MARGGHRPGAGRKPWTPEQKAAAQARREAAQSKPMVVATAPKVFAEAKSTPSFWSNMTPDDLRQIEEISKRYAVHKARSRENSPYQLPKFPKAALPPRTMAMDSAITDCLQFGTTDWLAGDIGNGMAGESLLFLGYSYLSDLAQRPEYRVMSETIADDATRKWIDFDVVGDERVEMEKREKDPDGYDERMADPDERKKRVSQAGKLDKVKALRDDQIRLCVKDRFYEQCRNDGFFGRTHLFLDIHTNGEPSGDELSTPIGDGRDQVSKTKVPKNSFKALRTIEPVWTYPLNYNATDPLREDWYNPQIWYVMGKQIHGSRLQTFIGHPVPDMLKPAYAFGGLSLTQMAKPYVDIWLQTRQSVADLIHSFSVMVLMTDLSTLMQPGNVGALLARASMFNMLRDNNGLFVVNKNTEEFKNVSASLSGLHELQAQAQEHMASVHRIPLVKFTGIQPAGLNASSEGEIEVYDDTIMAYQSRFMSPNLTKVINFEQLSLFGEIDPEITFRFEPLREMTQAEKGQKEKDDADRNQKYVDMGAIAPGEVRAIIINDNELPYTGLDPDDVPDLQAEEMQGLEPEGGKPQDPGDADGNGDDGGGANDAADFFGATDDWKEGDHPRAPDGKFGSGTGGKESPERKASVSGSGGPSPHTWMHEILNKAKERKKLAADLAAPGKPVRLHHADGRYAMAGPDMSKPGTFRLTRFDENGPVGHTEHADLAAAVDEGLRMKFAPTKPQAADNGFGIIDIEEIEPDVFVAVLAHDEAPFDESKHPRAPDGKFGTGSGGGAAASETPTFKSKKDHIGHLLSKGTTPKEVMQTMGWPSVSMPQQAAALGVKLEKYKEDGVTKYKSRAMTPEEQAEVDAAKAAKKAANPSSGKRGRAAADPETWSLLEFLASKGGLKPTADLQSIFGSKRGPFVPGFGPLLRPGGIDMDDALTFAKENSYVFDPNDIQHVPGAKNEGENTVSWQDLQDMIAEESRGKKQYRVTYGGPETKVDTEEESRHIVDALHREMAATGGTVDPALEDRVVQIMQREGEGDVLAAYERAIMEDHDRYEGLLDDRRDAGVEADGWDVHPGSTPDDGETDPGERREARPSGEVPF